MESTLKYYAITMVPIPEFPMGKKGGLCNFYRLPAKKI